jgi:hypothetical protein
MRLLTISFLASLICLTACSAGSETTNTVATNSSATPHQTAELGMTPAELNTLCGEKTIEKRETSTTTEGTTVIETRVAFNPELGAKKCGGRFTFRNNSLSAIDR